MLLEICVFNIASAIEAEKAGADRIELCENYDNGGTTPSFGYLKTVREKINIPVFPMIRPRGGDFFYSKEELEIMAKDIQLCKDLGYQGVVFGLLNQDGTIDVANTSRLVDLAYPMDVTFHRAFDRCKMPFVALENIIQCGCKRILTSGQMPKVSEGILLVKELVDLAGDRIIIMPGSGLNSANVNNIVTITRAKEVHSSARKILSSDMQYENSMISANDIVDSVNVEEIKSIKMKIS